MASNADPTRRDTPKKQHRELAPTAAVGQIDRPFSPCSHRLTHVHRRRVKLPVALLLLLLLLLVQHVLLLLLLVYELLLMMPHPGLVLGLYPSMSGRGAAERGDERQRSSRKRYGVGG